jgi:hypothetical protein
MEITPIAWLLVLLALILGFLVGFFRFKPEVPPILNDGISIKSGASFTIPASGGSLNFEDATTTNNIDTPRVFQIQLPKQIPPRAITFTNVTLPLSERDAKKKPNPGKRR